MATVCNRFVAILKKGKKQIVQDKAAKSSRGFVQLLVRCIGPRDASSRKSY